MTEKKSDVSLSESRSRISRLKSPNRFISFFSQGKKVEEEN